MAPNKKPAGNAKASKSDSKDKPKGKASTSKEDNEGGGKLKPATAINTRHILVLKPLSSQFHTLRTKLLTANIPVRKTFQKGRSPRQTPRRRQIRRGSTRFLRGQGSTGRQLGMESQRLPGHSVREGSV